MLFIKDQSNSIRAYHIFSSCLRGACSGRSTEAPPKISEVHLISFLRCGNSFISILNFDYLKNLKKSRVSAQRHRPLSSPLLFSSHSPPTTSRHTMTRLYSKGRIMGHQRGKSNSHPATSLIKIEGVENNKDAKFYEGKVRSVRRLGRGM